nr:SOS response-associated peptidase family protein [Maribacter sp. Hal144]
MCYSTQQGKPKSELEKRFDAIAKMPEYLDEDDLQRYHINGFAKHLIKGGKKEAPHPIMLVLPQENRKFLVPLMWGLIPSWESGEDASEYYKKTIMYGSGLNATSEKLFSSQMYKDSALQRRCIVPVTGFFEPHTTPVKVKGKPFKVPFFLRGRIKRSSIWPGYTGLQMTAMLPLRF